MALVSTRNQTIAGKTFKRGQALPKGLLTDDKAAQLVGLRRLQDTTPSKTKYIACRSTAIAETDYKRGELVDISKLAAAKVAQLLEHRIIEPAA